MSRRHVHANDAAFRAYSWPMPPRTVAVSRALDAARDHTATEDFLFLEQWERRAQPSLADTLRASQIRRANPLLAAELRAELKRGRPLTPRERGALAAMLG